MVKKRVGGAHRYKAVQRASAAAAAATAAGGAAAEASSPRGQQQQQQQQQQQERGPKPPSHLQRKITKQVKFYERVLAAQGTAKAPKGVQKRKQKKQQTGASLASLDSLAAELEHVAAGAAAAPRGGGGGSTTKQQQQQLAAAGRGRQSAIKRGRARLAVGVAETQRLQRVLSHPAYRADPVAAITNHLQATLPAAPAQQQRQGGGGGPGGATAKKKKQKKRKKGEDGVAAMQS